jgi:predicted  nucleic acid-binding Zn-ribbon protein
VSNACLGPHITALVNIPTEFGSNLAAVLPYALPLIFGGILLLLYQRFLPQEERRRNAIVFVGIAGLLVAALMILYAGFGSGWWSSESIPFGSYDIFFAVLQRVTNMVFTYSIVYFLIYLSGTVVIFVLMARYVITPPEPDFVALRDQLKELTASANSITKQKKDLESENKRLNEFIKEKEDALTNLKVELEGLKASVAERETSVAEMETKLRAAPAGHSETEEDLLGTISKKDETISRLQEEIADLRLMTEAGEPRAAGASASHDAQHKIDELDAGLKAARSKLDDYGRRAETAAEVSDSVISDLAELISKISSSELDVPTKKALSGIIEGLGRSMGRIAGQSAERDDSPKVELIGAVMMVHEIVDSVKKLTRK